MKASLLFDLSDPQDKEDFSTATKSQDWKDAFQAVFKYVRDVDKYESHEAEYTKAVAEIKAVILRIAEECGVSVW